MRKQKVILIRVDDELYEWLQDEVERTRDKVDLPKYGPSTVIRRIAEERMRRSKGRLGQ